jgi:hypothetical protein
MKQSFSSGGISAIGFCGCQSSQRKTRTANLLRTHKISCFEEMGSFSRFSSL